MKKKFSKGKWVISDDTSECFMIESEDGGLICTVHDGSFDDDAIHIDVVEANAKLITAAPEMLYVLSTIENDNGEIPDWLWKRIKDVIKKSTE